MTTKKTFLYSILIASFFTSFAQAELKVASIFGSHMVLQKDKPIVIWGTAQPGEEISLSLQKQSLHTTAGENGKWKATFEPIHEEGPFVLTAKGENNSIIFNDVLIGEVWLCSGQSNMLLHVNEAKNAEEEIKNANWPKIRLFKVRETAKPSPADSVRGSWEVCSPDSVGKFPAVGYYFGRDLYQSQNVPIGLIGSAYGASTAESWVRPEIIEGIPDSTKILDQRKMFDDPVRREETNERLKKEHKKGLRPQTILSYAYNGSLYPLIPYTLRGVIWYQGESNVGRADQYVKLFPALIRSWRSEWEQGDFPFVFVQLPNFGSRPKNLNRDQWARLREAQAMALLEPNTAMAITVDLGEADNIHPTNKQDVGKRLALLVRSKIYNEKITTTDGRKKPLPCLGASYRSHKTTSHKIVVSFDHVEGGLKTNDGAAPTGFAIAGADNHFVWAEAKIEGKDTVVLWNDSVKKPVEVRYNWANNPNGNLYNSIDLPTVPFRSNSPYPVPTSQ